MRHESTLMQVFGENLKIKPRKISQTVIEFHSPLLVVSSSTFFGSDEAARRGTHKSNILYPVQYDMIFLFVSFI